MDFTRFAIIVVIAYSLEHSGASAQCSNYSVETFSGPDCLLPSFAAAWGISDEGAICGGFVDCAEVGHPVLWTALGNVLELPLSAEQGIPHLPLGVNSAGQAVGRMHVPGLNPPDRAFLYSKGVTTNLGTMPGGNKSEASAINESGIVCGVWGNSSTGDPALHGFVWQDGKMSDLPLPMGPSHAALDIADSNLICGWMGPSPNLSHAFIYNLTTGAASDLGTVLPNAVSANATGINNDGSACGTCIIPCGTVCSSVQSFLYANGTAQNLGLLPGVTHVRAQAINDSNVIVGYCDQGSQAFVWRNGSIQALNDLIPPELNLNVTIAWDINSAGQIVGEATIIGTSDRVAIRLTPIPSPTGDSDCDGDVDVDDLLCVINHWADAKPKGSSALPPGDFDHDGVVELDDLSIVLDNWTK